MPNDEFRETHGAARDAGLRARHETREARAIRRQVADKIAAAILACAFETGDIRERDVIYSMERIARRIGSNEEGS
jgi:hypothetical protein